MADDKKPQSQTPAPPPVPPRVVPTVNVIKHSNDGGQQMTTRPVSMNMQQRKQPPKKD